MRSDGLPPSKSAKNRKRRKRKWEGGRRPRARTANLLSFHFAFLMFRFYCCLHKQSQRFK